jgi:hypothetical protein
MNINKKHSNFPEKKMVYREEIHHVSVESIERNLSITRTTLNKIHVSGYAFSSLYKINLQNTYRNITSIELISAYTGTTIDGVNLNGIMNEPYILLIVDELDGNFDSSNINISNAFCKLPITGSAASKYNRIIGGGINQHKRYYPTPLASLNSLTIRLLKRNGELANFGPEFFNTPCSCRYYTANEINIMGLNVESSYLFHVKELISGVLTDLVYVGDLESINILNNNISSLTASDSNIKFKNCRSITLSDYNTFISNYKLLCEIYSSLINYTDYLPEIFDTTFKSDINTILSASSISTISDTTIVNYLQFKTFYDNLELEIKNWCEYKAKYYNELYNQVNDSNCIQLNTDEITRNEEKCNILNQINNKIYVLSSYLTILPTKLTSDQNIYLSNLNYLINTTDNYNSTINKLKYYIDNCDNKTNISVPTNSSTSISWSILSPTLVIKFNVDNTENPYIDFTQNILRINNVNDIEKACSIIKYSTDCGIFKKYNNYNPVQVGKSIQAGSNLTFTTEPTIEECCSEDTYKKYAYIETDCDYTLSGSTITVSSSCCLTKYKPGTYLKFIDGGNTGYATINKIVTCTDTETTITITNNVGTINASGTVYPQASIEVLNKCNTCANLENCCFNEWIQNSFTFAITTREQDIPFQSFNLHY